MNARHRLAVSGLLISVAATASADWESGRPLEDGPTVTTGLSAGLILGLDGEVRETERPLYAVTDEHSGSPPERYSWKELGFDDSYGTAGIFLQRKGRYVTWLLDVSFGRPTASGIADRDYHIGVDNVPYGGNEYEQMRIPAGTAYDGEIDAYALALNARITPVSYRSGGGMEFVPWLHLGLFGFAGNFVIDAGEAQGVIPYENPPREYVVGGRGEGFLGVLVPELGVGGELILPVSRAFRISLQGFAGAMALQVQSSTFGVKARHEKNVDLEYLTYGGRLQLERILNDRVDLIAGVDFLFRSGSADVRAEDRPEEEVLELREKFDKEVEFEMMSAMAFVGLRF